MIFLIILGSLIVGFLALLGGARNGGALLMLSAFAEIYFIGTGKVPEMVMDKLQIHPPLVSVQWGARNAIVVLGGGAVAWTQLPRVSTAPIAASRIHEAQRLYIDCKKKALICKIVASGGDPKVLGSTESDVISRELVEVGVPEGDLIRENKSENTFQNAKFTSELLKPLQFDTLVLVTSGVHMLRSLFYFSKFTVQSFLPAPSDVLAPIRSKLPLSYNFAVTDLVFHEVVGIVRYHVYERMGWNKTQK